MFSYVIKAKKKKSERIRSFVSRPALNLNCEENEDPASIFYNVRIYKSYCRYTNTAQTIDFLSTTHSNPTMNLTFALVCLIPHDQISCPAQGAAEDVKCLCEQGRSRPQKI